MKLLFCEQCWDVIKLDTEHRRCKCGRVHGRYLNDRDAEVSPTAVSLAIGNGSLMQSIARVRATQGEPSRREFIEIGRIEYAWVRPNCGPGNPHCRIAEQEPTHAS